MDDNLSVKLIFVMENPFSVGTEEDKAQTSTATVEKQDSVNGDIRTVPSPKENLTPPQDECGENGKAEVLLKAVTHEKIARVCFLKH